MPRPLTRFLTNHFATRSPELGWEELKNGDLLNAAEAQGFEVLVTADKNLVYQQSMQNRKLAIVILPSGRWPLVRTRLDDVISAIDQAIPGTVRAVLALPRTSLNES